ncbi:hypothetical protein QE152_g8592 [Popillia japonica]|uniref:Uncharacterized protein n=1 Tax=Popillia japonica TaxID=7064 RepID=A0AAW1M1X4_POPJA
MRRATVAVVMETSAPGKNPPSREIADRRRSNAAYDSHIEVHYPKTGSHKESVRIPTVRSTLGSLKKHLLKTTNELLPSKSVIVPNYVQNSRISYATTLVLENLAQRGLSYQTMEILARLEKTTKRGDG